MNARLYTGNTNVVEIDQLKNDIDNIYLDNNAVVQLTVYDGVNEMAGQVWPVTMSYIGADGLFRVLLNSSLAFVHRKEYKLVVTSTDAGSGLDGQWSDIVTAYDRGDN